MGRVDVVITRIQFCGRKSRGVNNSSKCADTDYLGADCDWIGPNIDFCRLKAAGVEKGLLPAQNQGRQNGCGHVT
jgi:hypothetical protein